MTRTTKKVMWNVVLWEKSGSSFGFDKLSDAMAKIVELDSKRKSNQRITMEKETTVIEPISLPLTNHRGKKK